MADVLYRLNLSYTRPIYVLKNTLSQYPIGKIVMVLLKHEHEGTIKFKYSWIRRLVLIGIGIAITNQVSGINLTIYYRTSWIKNKSFINY